MKIKTWVAAASVLMLATVTASGCSQSTQPSGDEKAEISFLVFETPNLDAKFWDDAIARFEDDHPNISVNKLVSPDSDRNKYAQTLLSTGQFPDVQIALNAATFVEAGALLPYTDADLEPFLQPEAGTFEGKQYQTPWMAQGIPLMYYNKDLFDQAGLDAAPTNWDELLDAAATLKEAGITPFQIGGSGADSWASAYMVQGLVSTNVYAEDPDWILERRAGEVAFSDPMFVDALTGFTDVVGDGYINPDALSLSYAQLQESFLAGEAAMYPMGTWFSAPAADASFEVGVFPFPGFENADAVPVYTGGGITVSATTKSPEAAREFAIAFSTDPDNLTAFLRADATFPMVKGYELPEDLPQTIVDSYDVTLDAPTTVGVFGGESGDRAFPPGFSEVLYQQIQAMINGTSAEEAAAVLDAKWDELAG